MEEVALQPLEDTQISPQGTGGGGGNPEKVDGASE